MKKSIFLLTFCAILLAGCQMTDVIPGLTKGAKTFEATIVDGGTRATLVADGDIYHVTWTLNDRITVNGEYPYYATVGESTNTFFVLDTEGRDPEDLPVSPYKAVFPQNVSRGLPGIQNYVPNAIEFIPLYAESTTETLPFRNMVGLLKLNIKTGETGITVNRIVISADQPLCGTYEIEDFAAVVKEGGNTVTLNCGEGVAIGADPVPFLVSVPANTYTGMTVKVYTTDGKVASVKMKADASVKVERSKVYEAEFPFNSFTAIEGLGGTALLPSGQDFNAIIKQIALDDEMAVATTVDDSEVTRIVFNTLCADTEGLEIHDLASDKPIYLVYDKTSGIVNINTPAETIFLPEDASYMFARFGAMTAIDNIKCLNTENTENMSRMFYFISNTNQQLKQLDLSSFNTSNVSTMLSMFNGCRALEYLDVSSFNTENCSDISYMFQYCQKLKHLDVSHFNTENVTTLAYMFNGCQSLESLDLSNFNTDNCMNLCCTFYNCTSLQVLDLSSFETSNCTDFYQIFRNCTSLVDIRIPNFDISSATDVRGFFRDCSSLQAVDVSMLDGSHLTKNNGWFFYHDYNLREIYAGDTFNIGKTNAFIDNYDDFEYRAGSVAGGLTVYCNQDVADYLVTTSLRWINSGYHGSYEPVPPIPVKFVHFKTGSPINVEWPAN